MTDTEFYSESLVSGDMKKTEGSKLNIGKLAWYTHSSPDKSTGNEDCIGFCQVGENTAALILADGLG
ncbi:MAG: hypothetical protein HKN70_11280, partial [Gammaproteobacteria bacterium]|nr:hypothetical protein [Gammaproteobacteria bacterium]